MTEEINIFETYHLSTEGYYFKYRHDKYDHNIMRVTLWNDLGEVVDDMSVGDKSRIDIINHFETRIHFPLIK